MRQHTGNCPFPEHEAVVLAWFVRHKIRADSSFHNVLNWYSWRYEGSDPTTVLQITDEVLWRHSPQAVGEALESLHVNEHLKADPRPVARLVQNGNEIGLVLIPRSPHSDALMTA